MLKRTHEDGDDAFGAKSHRRRKLEQRQYPSRRRCGQRIRFLSTPIITFLPASVYNRCVSRLQWMIRYKYARSIRHLCLLGRYTLARSICPIWLMVRSLVGRCGSGGGLGNQPRVPGREKFGFLRGCRGRGRGSGRSTSELRGGNAARMGCEEETHERDQTEKVGEGIGSSGVLCNILYRV